jgi:ribosomal protein S18 acetylase RimI-like enzyme
VSRSEQGITLRPVQPEDREFLYRLYASTRAEEIARVDWPDEQKETFLRFQFDAQHTYYTRQFAGATFDVVLLAGRPVGRLYVDRRGREIRLIDIALLPEYRGRGLGGAMMEALLDEARERGLAVTIHVERDNPARSLYDRLGFRPVEEQGIYLLMEWRPT